MDCEVGHTCSAVWSGRLCKLAGVARLCAAALSNPLAGPCPLQGDMLLHLMDAAEPEFGSPVGAVPLLQLQSLLESAVRGSSAATDPAAAHLAAAWDHRSILNMLIANQAALAAPGPGGEIAGGKTPFSKVPGWAWAGRAGRALGGTPEYPSEMLRCLARMSAAGCGCPVCSPPTATCPRAAQVNHTRAHDCQRAEQLWQETECPRELHAGV